MTRRRPGARHRVGEPGRWLGIVVAAVLSFGGLVVVAQPAAADSCCGAIDGLVVKVAPGHTLAEVLADFPVTLDRPMLRSRGIFKLQPTDAELTTEPRELAKLAAQIGRSESVTYAEPNYATVLNSNRFHSWPEGPPSDSTSNSADWLGQPIATSLKLRQAHTVSQGLGVRVAILDTGVDRSHPAMIGRNRVGYDYVDDDNDPSDVRAKDDSNGNGQVDDAYGHGTFVAGLLALVAPDARLIPMRVLNSDGVGNVFVVSQAILEAADQGAKVINISFSTDQAVESQTLNDAIADVQARGVIVVAAAGNSGSNAANYPAADDGVLSVSATTSTGQLASWANRGSWVKVAAPGSDLVGPVPGGTYASWSGTSMATPVVAGQVALVRSLHPDWTTGQVIDAVTSTSSPLGGTVDGAVNVVGSLTG